MREGVPISIKDDIGMTTMTVKSEYDILNFCLLIGFSIIKYISIANKNEMTRHIAFALFDSWPIIIEEKLISGQCTKYNG